MFIRQSRQMLILPLALDTLLEMLCKLHLPDTVPYQMVCKGFGTTDVQVIESTSG